MSIVRLQSVRKRYGQLEVLNDISLEVEAGSVVVIIGRSGSGKSTLLRCINGLEPIQDGTIEVNGRPVTRNENALRALRRDVGFVFQSFNLFPHLTVERNLTIGLTVGTQDTARGSKGHRRERVAPGWASRQAPRIPRQALRRPTATGRNRAVPCAVAASHAVR